MIQVRVGSGSRGGMGGLRQEGLRASQDHQPWQPRSMGRGAPGSWNDRFRKARQSL